MPHPLLREIIRRGSETKLIWLLLTWRRVELENSHYQSFPFTTKHSLGWGVGKCIWIMAIITFSRICSFNRYSLIVHYIPGIIWGNQDKMVSKTDAISVFSLMEHRQFTIPSLCKTCVWKVIEWIICHPVHTSALSSAESWNSSLKSFPWPWFLLSLFFVPEKMRKKQGKDFKEWRMEKLINQPICKSWLLHWIVDNILEVESPILSKHHTQSVDNERISTMSLLPQQGQQHL